MCQRSSDGSPVDDPLGHHLADPAGAGEPVGAEPGGDEEPAHLALAEAELVVGRERLGAVDQPRDRDLVHRRDAPARVLGDLLEARPVLLEQPAVEVLRDAVERVLVERPRRAVALVAAHHEAGALLAEVDQQVGVAQRRQVLAGGALAERLRDEVLVRERDHRHAHAGQAADLGREHAAGVDDDLGLDRPHSVCTPRTRPSRTSIPVTRVCVKTCAPPSRAAAGQRVGQLRGVEVAVGRRDRTRSARRR